MDQGFSELSSGEILLQYFHAFHTDVSGTALNNAGQQFVVWLRALGFKRPFLKKAIIYISQATVGTTTVQCETKTNRQEDNLPQQT